MMASLWIPPQAGDRFVITGPCKSDGTPTWPKPSGSGTWPRRSSWQPRAWSSYEGDPASKRVSKETLKIDFKATFEVLEVKVTENFFQVRVEYNDHTLWINAGKKYRCSRVCRPWIRVLQPRSPPTR